MVLDGVWVCVLVTEGVTDGVLVCDGVRELEAAMLHVEKWRTPNCRTTHVSVPSTPGAVSTMSTCHWPVIAPPPHGLHVAWSTLHRYDPLATGAPSTAGVG